jgi:hypothetical protein
MCSIIRICKFKFVQMKVTGSPKFNIVCIVSPCLGLHIYSGQLICIWLNLHLMRKLHVKYNDLSLSSSWESCFSIAACAIVEPHTDPEVYIGVILNILIKITRYGLIESSVWYVDSSLHIWRPQGLWARDRCPIVLIFNTKSNRESVEKICS